MNEFINLGWTKDEIAKKIANEFPHGSYVNLGIGMPELVSKFVDESKEIIYHSENGLLGMGPPANENELDFELINAGKKPVTILPGGSYCHHADSFSMIRGGQLNPLHHLQQEFLFQSSNLQDHHPQKPPSHLIHNNQYDHLLSSRNYQHDGNNFLQVK